MNNIELADIKCSVCNVKEHCKECEKDIKNNALDEIELFLIESISNAEQEGYLNTTDDVIDIIKQTISEGKE